MIIFDRATRVNKSVSERFGLGGAEGGGFPGGLGRERRGAVEDGAADVGLVEETCSALKPNIRTLMRI